MSSEGDVELVIEELRSVVERLDDLALGALRAAVQSGANKRPDLERRLTRARHGIERVIGILEGRPG